MLNSTNSLERFFNTTNVADAAELLRAPSNKSDDQKANAFTHQRAVVRRAPKCQPVDVDQKAWWHQFAA